MSQRERKTEFTFEDKLQACKLHEDRLFKTDGKVVGKLDEVWVDICNYMNGKKRTTISNETS